MQDCTDTPARLKSVGRALRHRYSVPQAHGHSRQGVYLSVGAEAHSSLNSWVHPELVEVSRKIKADRPASGRRLLRLLWARWEEHTDHCVAAETVVDLSRVFDCAPAIFG
jgi:hypothetical protein